MKIDDEGITVLPDGSAFFVASYPLPKDHWLTAEGFNDPPAPMLMGTDNPERERMAAMLRVAGKYAIRASTLNGTVIDFDPDAMLQNLVVGMLGYWTPDGMSKL